VYTYILKKSFDYVHTTVHTYLCTVHGHFISVQVMFHGC